MTDPGDQLAADVVGRGRMRASHADREHAIEVLKAAFVQERLTKDELDTRVGQAFASRTYAELAAVTADLPAKPIAAQPSRPARAQGERRVLRPGTVLMVATAIYAGAWPVALFLPRDGEGEPRAGISLITMTTSLYVLVVVIAVVQMLNSRRDKRSRGQLPPRPGRDGRGLEGSRPDRTGRDQACVILEKTRRNADTTTGSSSSPGWNVDQLPGGTFRWTTPCGRSYDTEPTRYPV